MLRPALELAWAVAKVGSQGRPPLPVPGRLRPIMRVARLPDRMLETVRQVLESDDKFRERVVAAATDETVLGRPSWLWLVRPEGWESELEGLVEEAAGEETKQREKREAQAAAKQLAEVRSALQRAQAELVALKAVSDELRGAAAQRRKDDRAHEDELRDLRSQLHAARSEIEQIRSVNEELGARIDSRSAELSEASEQRVADQHLLTDLREQLEAARERAEEAESGARQAEEQVSQLRARLARAEAGARALADDIGGITETSDRTRGDAGESAPGDAVQPVPGDDAATGARPTSAQPSRRRRTPLPLPPATFEDSPEAAAHLVRRAKVLLAVDGYNVTLTSWPSLDLAEQRRRLVDSLAELVMRAGTEVLLVFDGTDRGNRLQPPPAVRGKLRVEFSPSEIEADDVIIGAVDSVPPERPVVVATNDRRVRDSTSYLGANVISVDQLLAVLGRGPVG